MLLLFANKPKETVLTGLLALIIAAMIILVTTTKAQESADTATTQASDTTTAVVTACQTGFKQQAANLLANYYLELDVIGKNNQVVSEQADTIMTAFRTLRTNLQEQMNAYLAGIDLGASSSDHLVAINSCQNIKNQAIATAQTVLLRFLKSAAAAKRDLALTEQYDYLLNNSDRLFSELSNLKSNFRSFVGSVPCITNQCVQN